MKIKKNSKNMSMREDYIVSCYGDETTDSVIKKEKEKIGNSLPDDHMTRFENALMGKLRVFPSSRKGQYKVHSLKDNGYKVRSVEITENDEQSCTCEDNFYRDKTCKHIWAVRIFEDYLPNKTEMPSDWIISELETDIEYLSDIEEEKIAILKHLESEIKDKGFTNYTIKEVCNVRYHIYSTITSLRSKD